MRFFTYSPRQKSRIPQLPTLKGGSNGRRSIGPSRRTHREPSGGSSRRAGLLVLVGERTRRRRRRGCPRVPVGDGGAGAGDRQGPGRRGRPDGRDGDAADRDLHRQDPAHRRARMAPSFLHRDRADAQHPDTGIVPDRRQRRARDRRAASRIGVASSRSRSPQIRPERAMSRAVAVSGSRSPKRKNLRGRSGAGRSGQDVRMHRRRSDEESSIRCSPRPISCRSRRSSARASSRAAARQMRSTT